MVCPNCDNYNIKVTDSRARHDGLSIRRRRMCTRCGHRWTTVEVSVSILAELPIEEPVLLLPKRKKKRE